MGHWPAGAGGAFVTELNDSEYESWVSVLLQVLNNPIDKAPLKDRP